MASEGQPGEFACECRGAHAALQLAYYRRAIGMASRYRRAAGYFSSSVFQAAFDEWKGFFSHRGHVEIVCSHQLASSDIAAIRDGIWNAPRWHSVRLDDVQRSDGRSHLTLLSWALAHGLIEIKVAEVLGKQCAIYHEKFGIFDASGNPFLGIEGSANETLSAICRNFERGRLYSPSDSDGRLKIDRMIAEFEALWHNTTNGLKVTAIQKALQSGIVVACSEEPIEHGLGAGRAFLPSSGMDVEPEILRPPSRFQLRGYQEAAVRAWFGNGAKGILEMATGVGKTFTALAAVTKLFELAGGPLALIVIAPYIHLVDQWCEEGGAFGLSPIKCYGLKTSWKRFVDAAVFRLNAGDRQLLSLVCTNATFSSDAFQEIVAKLDVRTVLIADEVHNLGASRLVKSLPERIQIRLGLSATPTRWMDEFGTDQLMRYFGPVVYRFNLKEALKHEPPVLTPYRYYPILITLEDDEIEEYVELTTAIARCVSDIEAGPLSDLAVSLLIKRSRLIASARGKLDALRQQMQPFKHQPFSLVYCGDGRVDFGDDTNADNGQDVRQLDAVTAILARELGMHVAQFTADTAPEDRVRIVERFSAGDLQAVVAIRCLDEGVNIPGISRAFILASSANPRQFIQRRGRILRRSPGKNIAEIFDFIVRPPPLNTLDATSAAPARRLIQNEMRRVIEFADLAQNGPEARLILHPVLKEFDLLHL